MLEIIPANYLNRKTPVLRMIAGEKINNDIEKIKTDFNPKGVIGNEGYLDFNIVELEDGKELIIYIIEIFNPNLELLNQFFSQVFSIAKQNNCKLVQVSSPNNRMRSFLLNRLGFELVEKDRIQRIVKYI